MPWTAKREIRMNQKTTFSTDWVTARNNSLAKTGHAIKNARILLEQAEEIYRKASFGQIPDIEQIVHVCHALGEAKNEILVGFVESSAVPSTAIEQDRRDVERHEKSIAQLSSRLEKQEKTSKSSEQKNEPRYWSPSGQEGAVRLSC